MSNFLMAERLRSFIPFFHSFQRCDSKIFDLKTFYFLFLRRPSLRVHCTSSVSYASERAPSEQIQSLLIILILLRLLSILKNGKKSTLLFFFFFFFHWSWIFIHSTSLCFIFFSLPQPRCFSHHYFIFYLTIIIFFLVVCLASVFESQLIFHFLFFTDLLLRIFSSNFSKWFSILFYHLLSF